MKLTFGAMQILVKELQENEIWAIYLLGLGQDMPEKVTKSNLINIIKVLCKNLNWIDQENLDHTPPNCPSDPNVTTKPQDFDSINVKEEDNEQEISDYALSNFSSDLNERINSTQPNDVDKAEYTSFVEADVQVTVTQEHWKNDLLENHHNEEETFSTKKVNQETNFSSKAGGFKMVSENTLSESQLTNLLATSAALLNLPKRNEDTLSETQLTNLLTTSVDDRMNLNKSNELKAIQDLLTL